MKAVGYSYLNLYYKLVLPKLGAEVYQDLKADKECIKQYGASVRKIIPGTWKVVDSPYEHMVLAIKHQGIRLHYFAAVFKHVNTAELALFIKSKPTSIYNRVIWYLYEWLTGELLDIDDVRSGNYIQLFDDRYYYTLQDGEKDKRTRVINNALGTREFCPTIRKTSRILEIEQTNVYETAYAEMQNIGADLKADVIGRSINYLYTKESKSSTEIEKETPTKQKMKRFLNTIKNAGLFELTKEKLIDIQNQIVEESKKSDDYRQNEIYAGATIQRLGGLDEDVHYIGPLAKHVSSMMDGLFATHEKLMLDASLPSLMHATVISFGEVYIHPLVDGNGRTHRYLIHDVMKQRELRHEFIIPISAAILKNSIEYDRVLETISRPIMSMLDYELDADNDNQAIIHNDIDYMYRYPDYTEHVVFVYDMMNAAISTELVEEICLLLVFDKIKGAINDRSDVPNDKLDTIVSIIINGAGVVSKAKQDFVSQFLGPGVLLEVEDISSEFINEVREKFEVDVQELMQRG
ncbi:Fic family protein [Neptuniibacter marinus]|uniref:Fic family protein n=1 Tax=Neptuniibacter marinus TaxID=1806670 RepID=UPI003B5BE095